MAQPITPKRALLESGGLVPGAVIKSPHDPRACRVRDVLRARSSARRMMLIDDEENIVQALRSGLELDSLYLTNGTESVGASILGPDNPQNVPTYILPDQVARDLFDAEKRSRVFALARQPRQSTLEDLTSLPGDIVVLDGVRIMGNIGAITRTAAAFGAAGIVLLDSGLASTVDRRLIRASRGLVFSVPLVLATAQELSDYLQAQGMGLASVTADARVPLSAIGTVDERLAILLGSERTGARDTLIALAQDHFFIPMHPGVESLNVSVAAAIALYQRQDQIGISQTSAKG